jgi:hypothetical protein
MCCERTLCACVRRMLPRLMRLGPRGTPGARPASASFANPVPPDGFRVGLNFSRRAEQSREEGRGCDPAAMHQSGLASEQQAAGLERRDLQ